MPTNTNRIGSAISIACSLLTAPQLAAQAPLTAVERPVFAPHRGAIGTSSMAYERARECVVLHDADSEATWEWYGSNWQRRAVYSGNGSASLGSSDAMTFDAVDGRCLAMDSQATWSWDGSNWTPLAGSIGSHFWHGFAHDSQRNRTVLFGGFGPNGFTNKTWEFDGSSWQQIPTTTQPPAGSGLGMVFDSVRGCMVVVAGASTWEWDGSTWTQQNTAQSPGSPGKGMAFDPVRGVTLLPLGNRMWEWDGVAWTSNFAHLGPLLTGDAHVAFDEARRELLVVERNTANDWTTYAWDGTWKRAARSSFLARNPAMTTDWTRQRIVAFGGRIYPTGTTPGTGPFYSWDAGTLEWVNGHWQRPLPSNYWPPARSGASMCFDSLRDLVIMFGGEAGPLLNDLWGWNGTDWFNLAYAASPPPARENTAIAYDALRDRVVLFGGGVAGNPGFPPWFPGTPGTYWGDTWEWDGINWTQRAPAVSPSPRLGHQLAYDVNRNRTVLFGGTTDQNGIATASNETWEWDGTTWQLRLPQNRPPVGAQGSMMFDPTRGNVIFVEQRASRFVVWEWNGSDWLSHPVAGVSPHGPYTPAAIDPQTGAIVTRQQDPTGFYQQRDVWIGALESIESQTTGAGCNSTATPSALQTSKPLLGDAAFRYELNGAPPSTPALLAFSPTGGAQTFAGCTLWLGALLTTVTMPTNEYGVALHPLAIPADPALRGFLVHGQGVTLDFGSAGGLAFSNAIRIRIGDGE